MKAETKGIILYLIYWIVILCSFRTGEWYNELSNPSTIDFLAYATSLGALIVGSSVVLRRLILSYIKED